MADHTNFIQHQISAEESPAHCVLCSTLSVIPGNKDVRCSRCSPPPAREATEDEKEMLQTLGDYAFGRNGAFWRGLVWSALAGAFLGLCALGFMNAVSYFPSLWQGEDYMMDATKVCYMCGKPWWIGVSASFGLLIGLIRVRFLPGKPAGFLQEAMTQHVDIKEAPWILVLTTLSLSAGASVGPEAGLGSLGGALGIGWAHLRGKIPGFKPLTKREQRMNTVTGMSGALGSLLPSPFLSVMLMFELGGQKIFNHYLESAAHSAVAATASYIVYQLIVGHTTLHTMTLPISGYEVTHIQPFKVEYYGYAILLGIASAFIGMLVLVLMGICKAIFARAEQRLGKSRAMVIMPTVAGIIVGVCGYLLPLTFGDGSEQLPSLIAPLRGCRVDGNTLDCYEGKFLSTSLLVATMFAKMLTFAVSSNFGMIGGVMFPNFFIGTAAGVIANRLFSSVLPIWISVPCMMAAVPASFVPTPITMALIPCVTFVFGGQQTAPVFIAVVAAYSTTHLLLIGTMITKLGGTNDPSKYDFEDEDDEATYDPPALTSEIDPVLPVQLVTSSKMAAI